MSKKDLSHALSTVHVPHIFLSSFSSCGRFSKKLSTCIPQPIPFLSTPQQVQTFGLSPLQRRCDVDASADCVGLCYLLTEDLYGPREVECKIRHGSSQCKWF
jgi:hypothetical protein